MAALLTEYHLTDPDDMHPTLALARYGKRRKTDAFLGFWLAIIVEAQQMRPNQRTVRKHIEKFHAGRDVRTALDEVGRASFDAELQDAARIYYASGLEDSSYTSTLMRMKRLSAGQVREKAAMEVVRTAAFILDARLEPTLIRLLVTGYLQALAPHGPRELREAMERYPQTQEPLEAILGDHP